MSLQKRLLHQVVGDEPRYVGKSPAQMSCALQGVPSANSVELCWERSPKCERGTMRAQSWAHALDSSRRGKGRGDTENPRKAHQSMCLVQEQAGGRVLLQGAPAHQSRQAHGHS